jgi:hypothetical protein
MEGLGRMDKAFMVEAFSSFSFSDSEPLHFLMNSPLSPTTLTGTSCRVRMLHAQGSCKPIPMHRLAGYHHHWSILICPNSPIQLAYHQTLPRDGALSRGPGFILNVAFMGMHLPLSDRYRPNVSKSTHTKPHRAYLSQATLPLHYNRVHALIRRERTVSAIHGRECALQG